MTRSHIPKVGGNCPWGKIQHTERIARGIVLVATASHGGFWISNGRQRQMPVYLKSGRWYEEDCEAAKVVVAFPEEFSDDMGAKALAALCNWFPEEYESYLRESKA